MFSVQPSFIRRKKRVQKGVQKRSPDHNCLFGDGGLGMMCVRFYLFHWYHVMCTSNEQQHYRSRSRVCAIIYPMCI
jgi:hypothetical protein